MTPGGVRSLELEALLRLTGTPICLEPPQPGFGGASLVSPFWSVTFLGAGLGQRLTVEELSVAAAA